MSRVDAVGLARQTAGQGVEVTTMEYFPPVESADINPNQTTLTIEETFGTRFPTGLDYGTRFFDVTMAGSPRMASFPRILSGFLGQPTNATVSSSIQHTFDPTVAGTIPEWHTIVAMREDPTTPIVDFFYDARGDELTFSVAANDYAKFSAKWIAKSNEHTTAAPTITRDATNRRKFSEVLCEISTDDGATWTTMHLAQFSLTYTNALDTDEAVLGSMNLYDLPFGNADCQVTFTPRDTLDVHYYRALQASPTAVALRFTATNGLTGASLEEIVWTIASCEYISAPAPISGANVLKSIDVTARAKLDTTTGKFVTAMVANAVASY